MQTVTKQTLKIYWEHTKRYKGAFALIVFCIVATVIIDVFRPFLFKALFNYLAGTDPDKVAKMIRTIWYVLGLTLLGQSLWRVFGYSLNFYQPRVMSDLLNTCYEYLLSHSYGFFNDNFVGSIVTRVRRFQATFERFTDELFFNISRTFLEILIIIGVMFSIRTFLGVLMLLWCMVYLTIAYTFTKYIMQYDIKKAAQETITTAHLADTITNSINIKLFTSKNLEAGNFARITDKLFRLRRHAWDLANHGYIFQSIALALLEFGVLYYAILSWEKGLLTIGDFVLLQAYLGQIFQRLWNLGKNLRIVYEALADANEMTLMLMEPHEIVDHENAGKLKVTAGRVEFAGVNFHYHRETPILSKFDLVISPGERVALIGPSGGGKSTIVKLLFRFIDVQEGQILVDGTDISSVTQDSLRKAISLVPQEPILFHRSLEENIRYGNPRATRDQIKAAAKAAHAHEFISKFPAGYDTLVGERGVKLSGGERQRVAIARAILKNAPILVLDEATSSLDSESESLIQDALHTLMKDKTTLVIAHRLSTIMGMDRIIVIEDGKITEQGKHTELVKASEGTYQRLWEIQAGGFT